MKLLILLVVLLLQRYAYAVPEYHTTGWLTHYFRWPRYVSAKPWSEGNPIGVIVTLLPLALIVALIAYLLDGHWFHVWDFLFQVVILWYCVNAYPLKKLANSFTLSNGTNATDKATVMTPGNEHMSSRALTENLFQHTTGEIFAVWFWYIILGPFGAVFYYALYSLLQSASRPDSEFIGYRDAATKLLAVINWLPVRIAGLGYALMGNFMAGFQFIMRHFRSGIAYNDAFTVGVGLAALHGEKHESSIADTAETRHALALVDRSLWLWLVVIALFTLGGWL